jgi:hypothetical protein
MAARIAERRAALGAHGRRWHETVVYNYFDRERGAGGRGGSGSKGGGGPFARVASVDSQTSSCSGGADDRGAPSPPPEQAPAAPLPAPCTWRPPAPPPPAPPPARAEVEELLKQRGVVLSPAEGPPLPPGGVGKEGNTGAALAADAELGLPALEFESRFEGGNLLRAARVGDAEYDLMLRPDHNTGGHTQWYYFAVARTRVGATYTFNITNFCKRDSLYLRGLRPLLFSVARARAEGLGWRRCGGAVCYFENESRAGGILRPRVADTFTLSFTLEFPEDDDTVYLAHCYPFSTRDLAVHLDSLEQDPARRRLLRRTVLCRTLAGNEMEALCITSPAGSAEEQAARPVVVLSARVHPGETNSSWMMKGALDFLTSSAPDAAALRGLAEFRCAPMLNPDGVANGNYRCNLAGHDLNRRWRAPDPDVHPTVFHHKELLKRLASERTVFIPPHPRPHPTPATSRQCILLLHRATGILCSMVAEFSDSAAGAGARDAGLARALKPQQHLHLRLRGQVLARRARRGRSAGAAARAGSALPAGAAARRVLLRRLALPRAALQGEQRARRCVARMQGALLLHRRGVARRD